jgi:hypothetical protein
MLKSREGESRSLSKLLGKVVKWVILLFGIAPFLQALGQQSLVTPLQEMLAKTLAFLPNIVAAAIILFIGGIIATIVREVVANFLGAVGADAGAERLGFGGAFGSKKLSGVAGVIAYFFIMVPIVMSAVDALQVTAISGPVKSTLERVLAAVPALLVAANFSPGLPGTRLSSWARAWRSISSVSAHRS